MVNSRILGGSRSRDCAALGARRVGWKVPSRVPARNAAAFCLPPAHPAVQHTAPRQRTQRQRDGDPERRAHRQVPSARTQGAALGDDEWTPGIGPPLELARRHHAMRSREAPVSCGWYARWVLPHRGGARPTRRDILPGLGALREIKHQQLARLARHDHGPGRRDPSGALSDRGLRGWRRGRDPLQRLQNGRRPELKVVP